MNTPTIMSIDEWMSKTQLGNTWKFFQQDRKKLEPIDRALSAFHAQSMNLYFERNNCLLLLAACQEWLDKKGNKSSDNAQKRKGAVIQLMRQVMRLISYRNFEMQKTDAKRKAPVTTADLHGKHQWENLKPKGEPRIGATMIGKALNVAPSTKSPEAGLLTDQLMSVAEEKSELSDLTLEEYKALEALLLTEWKGKEIKNSRGETVLAIKEINYCSKSQRLDHMLWPRNGRIYAPDGQLFSTRNSPGKMMIYAVDEYGNFFAGVGEAGITNHSSFNRGKPVICAGEIQASNGILFWLSNGSGHYRPTTQHLKNAVSLLRDHAMPLDRMMVFNRDATKLYESGTDFLNGKAVEKLPAKVAGNPRMP